MRPGRAGRRWPSTASATSAATSSRTSGSGTRLIRSGQTCRHTGHEDLAPGGASLPAAWSAWPSTSCFPTLSGSPRPARPCSPSARPWRWWSGSGATGRPTRWPWYLIAAALSPRHRRLLLLASAGAGPGRPLLPGHLPAAHGRPAAAGPGPEPRPRRAGAAGRAGVHDRAGGGVLAVPDAPLRPRPVAVARPEADLDRAAAGRRLLLAVLLRLWSGGGRRPAPTGCSACRWSPCWPPTPPSACCRCCGSGFLARAARSTPATSCSRSACGAAALHPSMAELAAARPPAAARRPVAPGPAGRRRPSSPRPCRWSSGCGDGRSRCRSWPPAAS